MTQDRELLTLKSPNSSPEGFIISGWCVAPSKVSWIDFNGDGKSDISCHNQNGGNTWVLLSDGAKIISPNSNQDGYIRGGWCAAAQYFEWTDFNGDGKSDATCHDQSGDNTWTLLSDGIKISSPNSDLQGYVQGSWCGGEDRFAWTDFNGDRKSDSTCHDQSGGNTWMLLSDGIKITSPPHSAVDGLLKTGWCGGRLHFEWTDFNGDGKSDATCHSDQGEIWVLLSDGSGLISPTISPIIDPSGLVKKDWCVVPAKLMWADFNGDGKFDATCHHDNGSIWVLLSSGINLISPNSDPTGLIKKGWCSAPGEVTWIDFNGDKKADISCYDKSTGKHWVLISYEQSVEVVQLATSNPQQEAKPKFHFKTHDLKKCKNIILGFSPVSDDSSESTIDIGQFGCTSKQQVSFKTIIGRGDTAISAIKIQGQEDYVACVYNFDADSFEFNDLLAQDLIILTNDQYHDDEL